MRNYIVVFILFLFYVLALSRLNATYYDPAVWHIESEKSSKPKAKKEQPKPVKKEAKKAAKVPVEIKTQIKSKPKMVTAAIPESYYVEIEVPNTELRFTTVKNDISGFTLDIEDYTKRVAYSGKVTWWVIPSDAAASSVPHINAVRRGEGTAVDGNLVVKF